MRIEPDRVVDAGIIFEVDEVGIDLFDVYTDELINLCPGTHVITLGPSRDDRNLDFYIFETATFFGLDSLDAAVLELALTEIA